MVVHVLYLIGNTLQHADLLPESLNFYRQAHSLAYNLFYTKAQVIEGRRKIEEADLPPAQAELLQKYQ